MAQICASECARAQARCESLMAAEDLGPGPGAGPEGAMLRVDSFRGTARAEPARPYPSPRGEPWGSPARCPARPRQPRSLCRRPSPFRGDLEITLRHHSEVNPCFCSVTKSRPTLAIPWTVAHQATLSMGFPRQEYWSGLPFPSPESTVLHLKKERELYFPALQRCFI